MVGVAALRGPQIAPKVLRQRLVVSSRSVRSISSFRPSGIRLPSAQGQLTHGLAKNAPRRPVPATASLGAIRFNSTSSETPSSAPADTSATPPATTPDDLSTVDLSSIPEHIGYLKQVGLDYGWGFTATMEWLTEHAHLSLGLPWISSIILMGFLSRAVLLWPSLRASDNQAKLGKIKHLEEPLRAEVVALSRTNPVEARKKSLEIKKLRESHGIDAWKGLVPLLQIPLGFGMFRLTRGMASLPVPELAKESFLWLNDLTVADPYWILPIASSAMFWWTLKRGGDSGAMPMINTPAGNSLLKILPVMTFLFMKFQPSALQLYFASTGLWGALQATIVNSDVWRRRLGLTPFSSMVSQPAAEKSNLEKLIDRAHAERLKQENELRNARKGAKSGDQGKQSFIDQGLNTAKESFQQLTGYGQQPKLKDGSPAPQPRKTDSQLRAAQKSEESESAESAADRSRRNEERFREYQQSLLSRRNEGKGPGSSELR